MSVAASRDIESIHGYIAEQGSAAEADRVLAALTEKIGRLREMPDRGNIPKELVAIGHDEFREAHYKPYRIIYRVHGREVTVYAVVDGRPDMQSFLQRRLLR